MRSVAALSATLLLALTTPFPRMARLLRVAKTPVVLVELLGLVYRSIFALDESLRTSRVALVARGGFRPLRVASEYTNIADRYLRDNHIGAYKVVPTWGASEAFLPDDADLLVDNTQTGKTLVENRLKIIEVILRSSACLIANAESLRSPSKKARIEELRAMLAGAVNETG